MSLSFALLIGVAAGGCAMDGDSVATESSEIGVVTNIPSFTLHVSQDENTVDVLNKNTGVFVSCPNPNGCDFAFLSGTPVKATPFPLVDRVNCVQFKSWSGDCTGSTCEFVMDRDKSIHANWIRIRGCTPL
jgi:hypothetical protein